MSEAESGFFKSSASNKSSSDMVSTALLSSTFHAEAMFSIAEALNVTLSLEPSYKQLKKKKNY